MKWRQGGIKRYEVATTKKLGLLIRDMRVERCISVEKFAKRTKLDPEFLRFVENGLASSDEIAQVFHSVVEALGVTCVSITKRLLDEETSLAKLTHKKLGVVLESIGLNCNHIALELLGNKPTPNSRGEQGSEKG
jgi:transcriptional regulator with XRE-family HTH domain